MCRAKERARDVVIKSDILENMQSHAGGTGPHNLISGFHTGFFVRGGTMRQRSLPPPPPA